MINFKNQSGQGILETIIAIGIIVTALVGTISLVSFTLRSNTSTLNRLIAQNLAWEGVEVVINLRDSNLMSGEAYNFGLDGGGDLTAIAEYDKDANIWFIDFAPNSITEDAAVLYREGGVYIQSSSTPAGSPTNFRRILSIEQLDPDQLQVVSTVNWNERGDSFNVSTSRVLYNWR